MTNGIKVVSAIRSAAYIITPIPFYFFPKKGGKGSRTSPAPKI